MSEITTEEAVSQLEKDFEIFMEISQNVSLSGCTNKGLSDLPYGSCST